MIMINFEWKFSRHYHHSSPDPRSFLLTLFPKRLLIICIHDPVVLPYNFSIHATRMSYGSAEESIAVFSSGEQIFYSKRQNPRDIG